MPVHSQRGSGGLSSVTIPIDIPSQLALVDDIQRTVCHCPAARTLTRADVTFYDSVPVDDTDYKSVQIDIFDAANAPVGSWFALGSTQATGGLAIASVAGEIPAFATVQIPTSAGSRAVPAGGSIVISWTNAGAGRALPAARVSVTLEAA